MNSKDCDMPKGCGQCIVGRTIAIAVLVLVPGAGANAQTGAVHLWPEAVISGDKVRLADVCRFQGIDPHQAAADAELVVAEAPAVGGSIIVSMDDVRRTLHGGGANLATILLKGAASCDVTRPAGAMGHQPRSAEATESAAGSSSPADVRTLRKAVEDFLAAESQRHGGRVQVQFGHVDEAVLNLSDPPFDFRIDRTSGRGLGLVGLQVRILADGEQVQSLPLMVNVSYVRPVVVAARPINLGVTLDATDVRVVEMGFTRLEFDGAADLPSVVGQRAKRFIPGGEVVLRRDLEAVPLVQRGQIVEVHSKAGGVAIISAAKALQSGAYGDMVELRSGDRRGDKLIATVTGPGRVSVGAGDAGRRIVDARLTVGGTP